VLVANTGYERQLQVEKRYVPDSVARLGGCAMFTLNRGRM
jgi:hypothetical protein